MLEGVSRVAIVGCANCAAACQTGGEKEVQEMKQLLESRAWRSWAPSCPTSAATSCW